MNSEIITCDCGFKWENGQDGHHHCGPNYRKRIEELEKEVKSAFWWSAEFTRIMHDDDILNAWEFFKSNSKVLK